MPAALCDVTNNHRLAWDFNCRWKTDRVRKLQILMMQLLLVTLDF